MSGLPLTGRQEPGLALLLMEISEVCFIMKSSDNKDSLDVNKNPTTHSPLPFTCQCILLNYLLCNKYNVEISMFAKN